MDENEVFTFRWTLEDYVQSLKVNSQPVYSPVFAADVPKLSYWRLKLYTRRKSDPHCVSCYLEYHHSNLCPKTKVSFRLSVVDAGCNRDAERVFQGKVFRRGQRRGRKAFTSNAVLARHPDSLLPGGNLTIECCLTAYSQCHVDAELQRLSRVFLGLFWTSVYSDLVLKSKTEHKFRVHGELIRARARKFHRVHCSNRNGSVKIHEASSDALRAFLMYLYSGTIKSTEPAVWNRLYEMSERYGVFDLRQEISPTPTFSSVSTRMVYTRQSIVFTIANFRDATRVAMGRLVDLGFARVGVEYYVNDVFAHAHQVGFEIKTYVYDRDAPTDSFACSVSVLDVSDLNPCFTSHHEVLCDRAVTVLRTNVLKKYLLTDRFLECGHLRFQIAFSVPTSEEPVKVRSSKTREASCIGLQPPSPTSLQVLSMDLRKLVESSPIPTHSPIVMAGDLNNMQKAVFSAWSWLFRDLFPSQRGLNNNRMPMNSEALEFLYEFMCSGDIPTPLTTTAIDVYPVATTYQLTTLRELIVRRVKLELNSRNAVVFFMFAHAYDIEELLDRVGDFISVNFNVISQQDSWRHLCIENPALVETVLRNLTDTNS